jgi:uncharacterized protein (DUF2141 family)
MTLIPSGITVPLSASGLVQPHPVGTRSIKGVPISRVEVVVTGIRSGRGRLLVALFNSPQGFPHESRKAFLTVVSDIQSADTKVVLGDVPYGEYAISVLHDENKDGRMDRSWFLFPKEGLGVAPGKAVRSGFEKAKFQVSKPFLRFPMRLLYPGYPRR